MPSAAVRTRPSGGGPRRPPTRRGAPVPSRAVRARRAVSLLVLTLLLPGSAQVAGGNRRLGRLAIRAWLLLLAGVVLLALGWLLDRERVVGLLASSTVLAGIAVVCYLVAVSLALLLADAWRLGRPRELPVRVRRWLALATAVLMAVTTLPLVALGRRVWAAADLIDSVLTSTQRSAAVDGRFTVLLLGGDAGPDRVGTRPDSLTLASIDARTGRTVLFSLPRNLENVPFPAGTAAAKVLPTGYSCGDTCLLNAVYTWGSEHSALFPGVADPGAEAMKQAVSATTGLTVNYYVLIDLHGFEALVDSVGGVRVTVKSAVPIGGGTSKVSGYIQPGTQTLDGYHALWFARSRHGASDYDRMARQRCVMDAMLHQLSPTTVLEHFQAIAAAGKSVLSTDIPASQLSTFLSLATAARSQRVTSVQFVPPLINPAYPDFGVIRSTVRSALAASVGGAKAGPAPAPTPAAGSTSPGGAHSTTGSTGTGSTGTGAAGAAAAAPGAAVDVSSVCAPA